MNKINAEWHKSITEIPEKCWNNLLPSNTSPFFKWEWLKALEKSKSICPSKGWQPLFLILWEGKWPIAAAPLYLKYHSFGEFIYDQQFANLAQSLGLQYYPKIVGMSPASPIEGYRFFFAKGMNEKDLTKSMMEIIDDFAIKNNILSSNFLYVDPTWQHLAKNANCSMWINQKSIWTSSGESNFCEFLDKFNSNQRRNIKKERGNITKSGIRIGVIKDNEITIKDMNRMHYFYKSHCARWGIWGSKYLSKSFFEEITISSGMLNNIILFCAYENNTDEPIAMSLCIKDKNMLWGRYWGTSKEINFLHFELCYYSPIAWAIENEIKFFDPGAGGEHKKRRGFLAKPTASMHRWYSPKIDSIIQDWLPQVNQIMMNEIESNNNDVPFNAKKPTLT